MRNEITSLMLTLSEKFSAVHSVDNVSVYPSLFDLIWDNSSNFGDASQYEMSTTNNTSDSPWTLKQKRTFDEMSDESFLELTNNTSDSPLCGAINSAPKLIRSKIHSTKGPSL